MNTQDTFRNYSLISLLDKSVTHYPQHSALVFNNKRITYADFKQLVDRVAAFLAAQRIKKGDHIGLYCPNNDAFPVAYFGILKAGAVVVPVNVLLSPQELIQIFNDAKIRALIFHGAFSHAIATMGDQLQSVEFSLGIGDEQAEGADYQWSQAITCKDSVTNLAYDPNNDVAAIIYTSGTTGRPKGAMLTHANLAANTWSVKEALDLQPTKDRLLVVLPMFHSFAATVGMLMPLLYGCTMVIMSRFDSKQVAGVVDEEKATIFLGVPTMYNYLLHLPAEAATQLASLRLCISGGAAMPAAIMQAFEEKFHLAIYEGDGPTECSPVTSVNPIRGERKLGSIGIPIPLVEMSILDDKGQELATGQTGEICVRGPNVMKGYWNMPEATQEAFFGEWFRTGDLGHQDEDGYFYIVDRLKDMIIYNGINVYPRIVEEVLYRIPQVEEAAVIGESHEVHGEIPVAYLALKQGGQLAEEEIIKTCRQHLGRHEIPRKIYFLASLPKNATGKILKRALRTQGEHERGVPTQKMPVE